MMKKTLASLIRQIENDLLSNPTNPADGDGPPWPLWAFWCQWPSVTPGQRGLPGLTGPPGPLGLMSPSDPSTNLLAIILSTCSYLEISTDGIQIDPTRSWDEIFHQLHSEEADGHHDSNKLAHLCEQVSNQQRELAGLHTKIAHLELASTPAAVGALQDELVSLRREINHIRV